jgi:hypothetical protein
MYLCDSERHICEAQGRLLWWGQDSPVAGALRLAGTLVLRRGGLGFAVSRMDWRKWGRFERKTGLYRPARPAGAVPAGRRHTPEGGLTAISRRAATYRLHGRWKAAR